MNYDWMNYIYYQSPAFNRGIQRHITSLWELVIGSTSGEPIEFSHHLRALPSVVFAILCQAG